MTEKLYEQDAYCRVFSARVIEIGEYKGKPAVVLDRTAFFPEGGGQQGDRGIVGSYSVTDTQITADGTILHIINSSPSFTSGDILECALDWNTRFARMQAHTGEHIISGLAHKLFGAENVGFHMDGTLMTVDFDRVLSAENLAGIERLANETLYKNANVRAFFPSAEEAAKFTYRSKLDAVEHLRLVEIEGCDLCACCAPHVAKTGEIGLIKILTSVSHRGGVRITLICGVSAYNDYVIKYNNTLYCAAELKAKHNELPEALDALMKKEDDLRLKLADASKKYTDYVYKSVPEVPGHGVLFLDEASSEELCRLADACKAKCGGISACFTGNDRKGYSFAMALPDEQYLPLTRELLAALKGRGGGKGLFLQGKCSAQRNEIQALFDALTVLQKQRK